MAHKHTLSLKEAVLININIMLGSGIFINTVLLAQNAALLSGCMYLLNGILVLPLILSMTTLMRLHPRGGFYTFGSKEISSLAGFISAWSYFIGKLASAALMIHTAFLLIQTIIPTLTLINILCLDIGALLLFTALNLLHMKVSMTVQSTAFIIKLMPIFFAILSGLFLISPGDWSAPQSALAIVNAIPLVLFTVLGFEATLSLSSKIENPHINGPRAILIAFGTAVGLSFLFQTLFYLALGDTLALFPNYLFAFPTLISKMCSNTAFVYYVSSFFHLAIATSALGGAYSILFSTHWNLYTIAKNNAVLGARFLTQLNTHAMPTVGIGLQAVICTLYFVCTHGNQVPLQLTATFGCTIAYTISVVALLCAQLKKTAGTASWITICALFNCGLFIVSGIYSLFASTVISFGLFVSMFLIGIGMHVAKRP